MCVCVCVYVCVCVCVQRFFCHADLVNRVKVVIIEIT